MFLFMYREFLDFGECPIILIFCPKYLLLKYKILFPPLSYFSESRISVFFFFIHIVGHFKCTLTELFPFLFCELFC